MIRWILLSFCLLLGCQSKKEPEKIATEIPAARSTELRKPPLQSILEWNFGKWGTVGGQPKKPDPRLAELCDVRPYQWMRSVDDRQANGPHQVEMIQIRVNEIGMTTFLSGKPMPVGSVVIKEKHQRPEDGFEERNDRPFAVAAMIKRETGYDSEHGDWEYAYQVSLPVKDKSLIQGNLATCIGCHQCVRDQDYLFRKHLSKQE